MRQALPHRPLGASDQAWADICAEIEDHLAEAYDEALEMNGGDRDAALDAALKDLGHEPARMVRRLWWDSLGGAWLRAWVQTVAIVILVTVVSIISVRLFVEFSAVARQGSAMLSAIPKEVATSYFIWRTVNFHVHRGSADGPAMADIPITLTGRPFKNDYESLQERTGAKGDCTFGPIRVGQYRVEVEDPVLGIAWQRNVTVYPVEDATVLDLILPEAASTALSFEVPYGILDAFSGLLIEGELMPSLMSDWAAPVYIALTRDGVRRANREQERLMIRRLALTMPERIWPYTFDGAPRPELLLNAGTHFRIVAVRLLDEQGLASQQRLPLEGERQFDLHPDHANLIRLPLPDSAVPLLEAWENERKQSP